MVWLLKWSVWIELPQRLVKTGNALYLVCLSVLFDATPLQGVMLQMGLCQLTGEAHNLQSTPDLDPLKV
jgi:hypothetical protein